MPLYEYKCTSCGHEFEGVVKHGQRTQKQVCPECEKTTGELVDKPQKFAYSLSRSFSRMRHGA